MEARSAGGCTSVREAESGITNTRLLVALGLTHPLLITHFGTKTLERRISIYILNHDVAKLLSSDSIYITI